MIRSAVAACSVASLLLMAGCNDPNAGGTGGGGGGGTHTHADGTVHSNDDQHEPGEGDEQHEHGEEVALPSITIGEMEIELAQGHGPVVAGQESHLVVKLPFSDDGQTIVRAWIGTDDRTLSYVGRGEYAASHDDYDIHATAPDPLPENAMWWIEIERPDGTKHVGSAAPILE